MNGSGNIPMMDEISQTRIQCISSLQVLESCPTVFSNFHVLLLLSWGSEYVRMNRNIIQCCIIMWLMHAHGVYPSQWTTRFTFFCIMRMLWEYQSFTVIYQLYKRDLHRNLIGGDFKSISFSPTHSLITFFTPSKRNIYFPRFGQNTTYQISYMPTHIKLYLLL